MLISPVTRSHKLNDRDHSALADGVAAPRENVPRYFAKTGPVDADPRKTKKDGGGKGNWGRSGDEMQDYGYTFTNTRRRSNSSVQGLADFRTKFETMDPEPVFEEKVHGPLDETASDGEPVTKTMSTSSNDDWKSNGRESASSQEH